MSALPPSQPPPHAPEPALPPRRFSRTRALLRKYGRMLWWLHSLYALGLGITVVLFAREGFAHARFLTITLALAWVVVIIFFRVFGSGSAQVVDGKGAKVRFFVMTYVLKNMYQGMLFFLLPFYWRSITLDSPNRWFLLGLGLCALLATLDVVFDRMLMRWKSAASAFYFFTLFACLNLVLPALLPNLRAVVTLVAAAALSALAFWTMHMPMRVLGRPHGVGLLVGWTAASLAGAWFLRESVPPVAMHIARGAVGPSVMPDGRLAIEARALHASLAHELYAVTDVFTPGGKGDRLIHVWRRDGEIVQQSTDVDPHPHGLWDTVRLRSRLGADALAAGKTGAWAVDVVTQDGQLVGRVAFDIIE